MKLHLPESTLRDIVRSEILRKEGISLMETSHWADTVIEMQQVLNGTHETSRASSGATTSIDETGSWDGPTQAAWEKFLKHYLSPENFQKVGKDASGRIDWSTDGYRVANSIVTPDVGMDNRPQGALEFVKAIISDGRQEGSGSEGDGGVDLPVHPPRGEGVTYKFETGATVCLDLAAEGIRIWSVGEDIVESDDISVYASYDGQSAEIIGISPDGPAYLIVFTGTVDGVEDFELLVNEIGLKVCEAEETGAAVTDEEPEATDEEPEVTGGEEAAKAEIMGQETEGMEYTEYLVRDDNDLPVFIVRLSDRNKRIVGKETGPLRDIFGPELINKFRRQRGAGEEDSFLIRWGEYEGMPDSLTNSMVGTVEFKITELKGINYDGNLKINSPKMAGTDYRKMFKYLRSKERDASLDDKEQRSYDYLKDAGYEILNVRTDRGRFKLARFEPSHRIGSDPAMIVPDQWMRVIDDNFPIWTQPYGQENVEVMRENLYNLIKEMIGARDLTTSSPIPDPYRKHPDVVPGKGGLAAVAAAGGAAVVLTNPDATYSWPIPGNTPQTISSHPGPRQARQHRGIDIAVGVGTPVLAVIDGSVTYAGGPSDRFPKAGCFVTIDHTCAPGDLKRSSYVHLKAIFVKAGENVVKGQKLGLSGGTEGAACAGNSEGPHLHLSLTKCGASEPSADPAFYEAILGKASRAKLEDITVTTDPFPDIPGVEEEEPPEETDAFPDIPPED